MLKHFCSQPVYEAWVNQVFYMFVQNWNTDINKTTRARCYTLYDDFRFKPYLNLINIEKVRVALSRFRVSAHRLDVETGRWHKPVAVPFNKSKCRT